jgi:hypothetical protein
LGRVEVSLIPTINSPPVGKKIPIIDFVNKEIKTHSPQLIPKKKPQAHG